MPFHGHGATNTIRKPKNIPPEETSQEAAFLKALGENQKTVAIKLADGEIVHGWIEYYDKNMVRLTREDQPNLLNLQYLIIVIICDFLEYF